MKKGQATLFIILGIVVLIIIGIIAYSTSDTIKQRLNGVTRAGVTVPEQIVPVSDYIDNCLNEVVSDGVNILGQQGGYIELLEDPVPRGVLNKFSNSLEIFPNYFTSYWFYEAANGVNTIKYPTRESMETDLNNYVENNINDCFDNFEVFRSQGYKINTGDELKAVATINDEHVSVDLIYRVDVSIQDVTKTFNDYFVDLQIPLGNLYNKGKDIVDKEVNEYYFEEKTIDMLIAYDELPYSGESFDCTPKVWLTSDIEKNFKEIAQVNVNEVKVAGSSNGEADAYYSFDTGNSFNNINVNFRYSPDWPFDLSIDGGEDVLKERKIVGPGNVGGNLLVSLFCLNNYNFIYDVKYPILVILDENGYVFQFATQVRIDNNQPIENVEISTTNELQKSLACETSKTPSIVYALDNDNGAILNNVNVELECAGSKCDIGTSNGNNDLEFPACLNGNVVLNKDGYHTTNVIIDTTQENQVSVYMKKRNTVNVELKAIENGRIRDLRDDEQVFVQMYDEDDAYSLFVTENDDTIDLLDGNYAVKAYITQNGNINIQGKTVEQCTETLKGGILGFFGVTEQKCFERKLDDVNTDQVIIGGEEFAYQVENSRSANKITFYLYVNGVPKDSQQVAEVYDNIVNNFKKEDFRKPELI